MSRLVSTAEAAENAENLNTLTNAVISAAIEVHRTLGPGLLESAYETCLCHEFALRDIPFERQVPIALVYKGVNLSAAYRADIVVAKSLLIEIKAVDALLPIHDAQLISYLKLSGYAVGLLLNFNVRLLKQGIRRRVLGLNEEISL